MVCNLLGQKKFIALGVCSDKYPSHRLPGWEKLSVGLHLDNATLMQSPNETLNIRRTFHEGDSIKCSVREIPSDVSAHATVKVEFFCNSEPIISTVIVKPSGGLYGIIGMMSRGEAITLCPPELSMKMRFEYLWEISTPNLVQHRGDGVSMYVGPGDLTEHCIGTVRSIKPVIPTGNLAQRSFSLSILDSGAKSFIAMGLVNKTYPTHLLPGWEDSSIGYHADSGDIFHNSSDGDSSNVPCKKGDTMQCLVTAIDDSSKRIKVTFLCNNVKVKEVTDWTPSTGFYFCFGMMSKGEIVQVILPDISNQFSAPKLSFGEVWEVKNSNINHIDDGVCRYVGQDKVGTVRSKHPIDPFSLVNYFEVRIIDPGVNCYIALGVCSCHYSTDHLPGWEDLSVGYHADDGAIVQSSGQEKVGEPCQKEDVIRCTLSPIDGSDKQMNVVFHKNGSELGKTIFWKPSNGMVLAQIGCMGAGEVIQIASPLQGISHLSSREPSAVQSFLDKSLSPNIPRHGSSIQDRQALQTVDHARMAEMQQFFEMFSKFQAFASPSSESLDSTAPRTLSPWLGQSTSQTTWDQYHHSHTHPQNLSASYPGRLSQDANTASRKFQEQLSMPPLAGQQGISPQVSLSSWSSSSSGPSKPDSSHHMSSQFSVTSVSSLESIQEDEGKGQTASSIAQNPHAKSMKQAGDHLISSAQSVTTMKASHSAKSVADNITESHKVPEQSLSYPKGSTPQTSAIQDLTVTRLPPSTCVASPVILDKRENSLFKILYNAEVDSSGMIEYAQLRDELPENSFIMYRLPLSEKSDYFEVKIHEISGACNIAVGLVRDQCTIDRLPGVSEGSLAFHSTDGNIWQGGVSHLTSVPYANQDVLGCRANLHFKSELCAADGKDVVISVEFFINGMHLHTVRHSLPPHGLFPVIGINGSGWKVSTCRNALLRPEHYFKSHPLPPSYTNFDIVSNDPLPLWRSVAESTIEDDHLFLTRTCCGHPSVVQSNIAFSAKSDYFETQLLCDVASFSVLSIGIGSRLSADSKKLIPGEVSNSVAFLPLLGFFMSSGVICWTAPSVVSSNLKGTNVSLGIGVEYSTSVKSKGALNSEEKHNEKIKVFFTVNGQQIHDVSIDKPSDDIYPSFACEFDGTISDPIAILNFPKLFPSLQKGLPFGFSRGKCNQLKMVFDLYTVKNLPRQVGAASSFPSQIIQASQPLSPAQSYFELKVLDGGGTYIISCGLACYNYSLNSHPGWEVNSIALHLDDGNLFVNGSHSNVIVPPRHSGAFVGCGIRFSVSGSLAEVFFTVNKRMVACKLVEVPQLGLYPTVGLRTGGGLVEVNIHAPDPYPLLCFKSEVEMQHNMQVNGSFVQLQSPSNPGAIQMKNCKLHQKHFIEVKSQSERNGRILIGYSTNKSCPLNFLKSQPYKACVIDIVSGTLMLYNQYFKSKNASCIFSNCDVGIGLEPIPDSTMLLLFVVSKGYVVSYCEIDIEDSGLYPCLLMMDSTTKIDVNWCGQWPKLSPIGYGWGTFVNLKLDDSKITHSSSQIKKRLPVGYAQASTPFTHSDCYFEVEICSRAVNKAIAIGLASLTHSTAQWIGWSENSIGYHTDDGKLFKESSSGQTFGPKAYAGDIIGCGARMKQVCYRDAVVGSSKVKVEIFFTINGALLNTQKMAIPQGGLFPTICLESPSESIIFHRYKQFPPVASLVNSQSWGNAYSVKQVGDVISNSCRHKEINGALPKSFCQAKLPFSPECPFFQVELATLGANSKGSVFVGAAVKIPHGCTTPNTHSLLYSSGGMVMTRKGSQKITKGTVKSDVGDVIGILTLFNSEFATHLEIFINHSKVYTAALADLWTPQNLFPTVVLGHPGDSVIPHLQMPLSAERKLTLIGWLRSERVKVHNNIVEYTGHATGFSDIGVAQVSQPLQLNSLTFFEVEVISSVKCVMGVGVASSDYPLNRQPGWCKNSIAYHGDDGKLFHEDGMGFPMGPHWKQHDIIGVGMHTENCSTDGEVQIFFTKNGLEIGHTTVSIPPTGLFPVVGFHYEGLKVKINLGSKGSEPCNKCPSRTQWRSLVGIGIKKLPSGQMLKHCANSRTSELPYLISLAIYGQPLRDKIKYFEVEIRSLGAVGIAIGVVPPQYPLNKVPGWRMGSIAYHTDNGRLYNGTSRGNIFGPIPRCGDVIGCGVSLHPNNTKFCSIFFTYNGIEIGQIKTSYHENGLYPAVGLTDQKDSVLVNFSEVFKPRLSLADLVFVNLMRISNCSYADYIISYSGTGTGESSCIPAIAQFSVPISKNYSYYSANILETNDDILMGLAVKDHPLQFVPGIAPLPLCYNATKGKIQAVYSSDRTSVETAKPCVQGDTIGCGIQFTENTKENCARVYFTRNNKKICELNMPEEFQIEDLYPAIAFIPQEHSSYIFMHWNTCKCTKHNVFN